MVSVSELFVSEGQTEVTEFLVTVASPSSIITLSNLR